MNEQLSVIIGLIELEPNKTKILNLIQESYLERQKYFVFFRFFSRIRKVINDLERLKKMQMPRESKLIKQELRCYSSITSENYPTIERDIINKYNYYYTAFIIDNLIYIQKRRVFLNYIITILLTIISITLTFIASIIKK